MTESFGIMDEGYFVSRKEVLRWTNSVLKLDIAQVEQLGSGAIYAQLLDSLCPGKVALSKINWKAKHEYEFIQNFKVLQQAFDKLGISKKIDIQKLAKSKYQDNLEMIQWMKRFIEVQGGPKPNYDPEARRNYAAVDFSFVDKKPIMLPNKQNIKKPGSSGGVNATFMCTSRSKPDLLDSGLKTPSRRESLCLLSNFSMCKTGSSNTGEMSSRKMSSSKIQTVQQLKTTPRPSVSNIQQKDKLEEIKKILTVTDRGEEQLERIRQLLQVPRIVEEDDEVI